MSQSAHDFHTHEPLSPTPHGQRAGVAAGAHRRWRAVKSYLLALLFVAIAAMLTIYVPPLKEKTSLIIFFAAVVISSYVGGLGPALMAVALSAFIWATFVVPPNYSYVIESPSDALRLVLFVLVALLTSSLHERHARTKAELRKHQHRLDLALEAGRMGVWDYDLNEDEFWISPALLEIFGVGAGEFAPTYGGFLAFVHPDDRAAVVRAMTTSRESNVDYQIEYRLLRRDGTVRRLATRGRTFVDSSGRVERMIGLVVDLTDSPEAETMALHPPSSTSAVPAPQPARGPVSPAAAAG
jgi:PAS domain S-box-containing protein